MFVVLPQQRHQEIDIQEECHGVWLSISFTSREEMTPLVNWMESLQVPEHEHEARTCDQFGHRFADHRAGGARVIAHPNGFPALRRRKGPAG